MYTLYYSPGACSLAVQVKLQATGVAYKPELVDLKKGNHLTPDFAKVNPVQRVPVLEFSDHYLTEAMAILLWLEQHPQGLLPGNPVLHARVLQKMNWLSNSLHQDFAALWRPQRFTENSDIQAQISHAAMQRLIGSFECLERELGQFTYWLDDTLTLADYYLLPFLRWGHAAVEQVQHFHELTRYVERLGKLPEVISALEVERISLLNI
ncbi:glutathione S-transferase family protein [Shewanella litorisediminis]|uniref:Glutathione S-transferase family protein n=1 Tax=Shewanella litorisediminis TaxID=1173586 RepID=A0ABX7G7Y6_9GAMM|nr:glutathione S-transferase family protein [Shewanella litorisediminis]MCL2920218.1 glutathione S-transferase family protein [Shewanella litorisediminis]QRH03479.1 glutathione S-transferase family protein [Shewanella litorisediminis]